MQCATRRSYKHSEPCHLETEIQEQQLTQVAELQAQGLLGHRRTGRPRLLCGTNPPSSINNASLIPLPKHPRQYAIWLQLMHRTANKQPGGYEPGGAGVDKQPVGGAPLTTSLPPLASWTG